MRVQNYTFLTKYKNVFCGKKKWCKRMKKEKQKGAKKKFFTPLLKTRKHFQNRLQKPKFAGRVESNDKFSALHHSTPFYECV